MGTLLALILLFAPQDPEQARTLLKEAGYPGGEGFPKLSLLYNTADWHRRLAAALQQMWRRELGIDIELVNSEWKVYLDRVDRGDYDIARRGWIGEYADPHAFLDLFSRDSGSNSTGWTSEPFERLLADSCREPDPARRLDLLARAERTLLDDAPLLPLFHYVNHNYLKSFIRGFHPNQRDIHPIQHMWLEGDDAPKDGVLIFNGGEEPNSLDPALSHDIAGFKVLMHLFEGLAANDPRTAAPVPAAAERWDVSPDGLTWTFPLRESRWSNGDPVTARDFVYAWRRVVDPKTASTYAHRMFLVKNGRAVFRGEKPVESLAVRAEGDRTLIVELEHPAPYFADLLCLNLFFPVHQATVEKHGTKWTRPENLVGNGPYRLLEWKLGDRKVFEARPDYRDAASVKQKKFVFLSTPDVSAAFRLYEAGQCHWLYQAPTEFMEALRSRPDHVVAPYNAVYFYVFNTKRKPLDDVRVRRALSLAVDRAVIVKSLMRGGELAADRFVPPTANPAPLPQPQPK